MARITKAHHTGFTVRSLERSIAFYRDILGFELAFQWNPQAEYIGELVGYPSVDLHGAILRLPGTDVCLELLEYRNIEQVRVDMRNGNIGNGHIAFNVDDLMSLYEELVAKGVKSVSAPVTPTIGPNKGGKAVYLIDPDGFRVELIQSAQAFGSYKPE
ncbi:VOC family protein [Mesorhizobium sp. B3-1-9]|uniref:VOC family protein n=1 Tax=unclassified Mesorhizobium TaxID=325217 RepID=UPI00112E065A|nr:MULTISPECIES: VOC family protein [unclassified Mesorhizobium]TPI38149.1 VOC family protein [Mesorhizobium sp. B3-1-9]TPI59069.1 VOC family protein [Mesorhizobium sp. B3-1-7]TPI69547.1 VOC family protein [Mesorhizobium sp. B3-1-8]TPI73781.1 VOC family protein [Mesorhizobium sp. B3-1-3]TPJ31307.1 VOC family protein [Mesorhizobium sp. B2-8-3]